MVNWCCEDMELAEACAVKAHPIVMTASTDALSWEPAPKTLCDILKMPEGPIRTGWLKSVKAELKTLFDPRTFVLNDMRDDEVSTPVMEIFKVKINSNGTLDKLKTRIVVHGDLQGKSTTEDKWSPTASFRSSKMFLAHACRLKVRVKQLNFIGAFLQANMQSRMFFTLPKIFGILFPEYEMYCGIPV
jgi:hypothetical protein